jgi:hypothetical protein
MARAAVACVFVSTLAAIVPAAGHAADKGEVVVASGKLEG